MVIKISSFLLIELIVLKGLVNCRKSALLFIFFCFSEGTRDRMILEMINHCPFVSFVVF